MKENVIIGKLIPAGTGMKRYRNIKLDSELVQEEEFQFDEFDDADFDADFDEAEALEEVAEDVVDEVEE